jgi:methionine-rich copper-binding protein CopC
LKKLKQFHYPTSRQAIAAVIACAVLLSALVVVWLAVTTNTAILHQKLDQSDVRQRQLTEDANAIWKEIGDITSPAQMTSRMQSAGFGTPAGTEYIVAPTATLVVSPTVQSEGVTR